MGVNAAFDDVTGQSLNGGAGVVFDANAGKKDGARPEVFRYPTHAYELARRNAHPEGSSPEPRLQVKAAADLRAITLRITTPN